MESILAKKPILLLVIACFFPMVNAAGSEGSDCEAYKGQISICGVAGSEDLEVIPESARILVSQAQPSFNEARELRWLPGSIAVLDSQTGKLRVLYPVSATVERRNVWGADNCPGEIGATLSPHGIHLSRRNDGLVQLLVVNHGGRESVEMFELTGAGGALSLTWRGCVVMPDRSFLNDVVALPEGGFLVTHMVDNSGPEALAQGGARAARGENTGHVWHWSPTTGTVKLAGSESAMPNGIQIDQRGVHVFVNTGAGGGEVRRFDRERSTWTGSVAVAHPDNSSWTEDGRLLVTGLTPNAVTDPCMASDFRVVCEAEFHIDVVDPITMHATTLLQRRGRPMGLATVAVQVGRELYIGSAAGDRILRLPLPATESSD